MTHSIYIKGWYNFNVLKIDSDKNYIDLRNMRKYYVTLMTQGTVIVVNWNTILSDDNLGFVVLN